MKKIFFLGLIVVSNLTQAQVITENFDVNTNVVSSFTKTLGNVSFTFTFTADGDGGDFAWEKEYGDGNSSSINAQSFGLNTAKTEKITIIRTDGKLFKFTSIYVNNTFGSTITVGGYNGTKLVGSTQSAIRGFAGTMSFGDIIVSEVRFTATDFSNSNFDLFKGNLDVTVLGEEDIVEFDSKLTISPNPSKDFIKISGLESKDSFSIYNTLGENLIEGKVSDQQLINISDLENGVYYLKIESGSILKFIKD